MTLRFDADGDVIATAADGSFVVARGDRVDVYDGTTSHTVATKGDHAGVSLGGEWLAVGTRDRLELWSCRSGTRTWAVPSPGHYGQPMFHGDRVITHHRGGIRVWDVATGELVRAIEDDRITIARESFLLDGETVALRCGANAPGFANVALISISLAQGKVLGFRRSHYQGTVGAVAMTNGRVLTAGRHELRIDEGTRRLENPCNDEIQRLFAGPRRIVLGCAGGIVRAWSFATNQLVVFETGRTCAIVHVRDDDNAIHAIDSRGATFAWPAPADADGAPVLFHIVPPTLDAWQASIVLAAEGRLDEAVLRLDMPEPSPKYLMARAFFESVIERDEPDAFRRRCERAGLAPRAKLTGIATDLLKAEIVYLALGAYLSWLDAAEPGPKDQQIALGIAIADHLSRLDDLAMHAQLLDRMKRVFPSIRRARPD